MIKVNMCWYLIHVILAMGLGLAHRGQEKTKKKS
jgi:hypothetical protein